MYIYIYILVIYACGPPRLPHRGVRRRGFIACRILKFTEFVCIIIMISSSSACVLLLYYYAYYCYYHYYY